MPQTLKARAAQINPDNSHRLAITSRRWSTAHSDDLSLAIARATGTAWFKESRPQRTTVRNRSLLANLNPPIDLLEETFSELRGECEASVVQNIADGRTSG